MQVNVGGQSVGGAGRLLGGCSGCGTALLFLVVFGGVGIGLGIWGWGVLTNARTSEAWPTVEGRVVRSEVDHSTDSEGGDSYLPQIDYTYTLDGMQYENDRVRFGENSYSFRRQAEAEVERYPVGRRVDVYYEPGNPENSVLEPGATLGSYLGVCLGAMFLGIGLVSAPLTLLPRLLRRT